MDIWCEVKSYSSVFKQVERAINDSDPIASESMVRHRIRMYWVAEPDQTTKNCLRALGKSIVFQTFRGGGAGGALRMGSRSGLDISRTMPTSLSNGRVEMSRNIGRNVVTKNIKFRNPIF